MARLCWALRVISALVGSSGIYNEAVFNPQRAVRPRSSRTHVWVSSKLLRTIHKLDSANKVVSCAVFLLSPR